jgi:hypothetical protein
MEFKNKISKIKKIEKIKRVLLKYLIPIQELLKSPVSQKTEIKLETNQINKTRNKIIKNKTFLSI